MVTLNRLDKAHQAQAIRCLIEGNSIRSTVRMTGVAKNTVVKLLVAVGSALSRYQDEKLRNLHCQRIQCDEIWSFVYARQKNVTSEIADPQIAGDVWTWTAIDAETKLIPCWLVGKRDAVSAEEFIKDLAGRLENRVQLTTDRLKVYLSGIVGAFDEEIDYAILHKIYGADRQTEARYSPAICTGCEKKPTIGDPDPKHISTGYVERQNFTMRMSMRRFTRLTNAFSKKVEDHAASIALYLMWYNFGRIQQTLKMTPAMRSGLSFTLWTVEEILALADGSASD